MPLLDGSRGGTPGLAGAPSGGLTRRAFLQGLAASAAAAVVFTGCAPASHELEAESRVLLAEDTLSAFENWYATACRQCDAGCGLIARVIEGRAKKLEGNPDHPLNRGKLCARGQAGVQEQYHPDRVQGPLRRSGDRAGGPLVPISWDQALDELVGRLRALQQQGQTSQVVLLTRPLRAHLALVVDRFRRAYGADWLTLDPVSEAPLREAARRVFGADRLPVFDLQNARYVLSFGANFLETWLSPVYYGVQYGLFRQGSYRAGDFRPRRDRPRGYLVQVEPRFSATAANADEWVPVRPGTERLLALSLAQVLLAEGLADPNGARAFGGPGALDPFQPERVADQTGVAAERIRGLARAFASQRPSLALGGGLAGAQTTGTETLSAILALNLLVGNVGQSGGVRFAPPPPIPDLPTSPPTSRLSDWQRLADRLRGGQVQLLLVHQANPVHTLPGALGFGEALGHAPFIVSFSSFLDDTTAQADLILPSSLPLEDWGDDVPEPSPGAQVLTLQQPVLRPFYDTRGFADVLLTLGEELGGAVSAALPWPTFKEVLRDGARQLQQLRRGNVQEADFERFWTTLLQRGGWWDEQPPTPPMSTGQPGALAQAPAPQLAGDEQQYPYALLLFEHNTLGAGETAHLPWLQAAPDPVSTVVWQTWVELNPKLAAQLGLREGDVVALESPHGRMEVPVYVNPAAPPMVLSVPLGQGHANFGRWAAGRGANPMVLLAPLEDAATGALAYAATRVRLVATGRSVALPKFEGGVVARQLPGEPLVEVTRG